MHELALCGSIADIVTRRAGARPVETVHLRIGQLRQVVPDTLAYCWELVTASTPLAGCELAIERVAARLRCERCATEFEMGDEPSFRCPQCRDIAVQVVAGEEFVVTSMDVGPIGVPR